MNSKKKVKKVKKTEYEKISETLERLELCKYPIHSSDWCADRITWAWKFRKITEDQKNELVDRTIKVQELEHILINKHK